MAEETFIMNPSGINNDSLLDLDSAYLEKICKLLKEIPDSARYHREQVIEAEDEIKIPITQKLNLTVKEAAAYSGIGINRIDSMLRRPNCPFALFVGTRKLVKRKAFEEYLARELVI